MTAILTETRLQTLRNIVAGADYECSLSLVDEVRGMDTQQAGELAALSPEANNSEYLANLTGAGDFVRLQHTGHEALGNCHGLLKSGEGSHAGCVLALRWFAHLVGLRHAVVHAFLDPDASNDMTWVQVRSYSKPDRPGCFDVALGGHVRDFDTVQKAFVSELREELGLDAERDLKEMEHVATYQHIEQLDKTSLVNVEYRQVNIATLNGDACSRLHFADGEVAAFCLFAHSELARLIEREPEKTASGLTGSYPYYLEKRNHEK